MLKDGRRITSHEIRFSAVDGVERNHVVLEKGNETTFIETQNDPEFFEYLNHFERLEDEFGNGMFVYIEDIKGYNQAFKH